MNRRNRIHPLEPKLTKIGEGYRLFPEPLVPLSFRERDLLPADVVVRAHQGLEVFAEVRRCQAQLDLAIEARDRAVPTLKAFVAEAMAVARKHFGSDAKRMAVFGEETRAPRAPSKRRAAPVLIEEVVTTVVEEVSRGGAKRKKR